MGPGPVWTSAENLASTGIRSPECPARSQSLYRLSYPAHVETCRRVIICEITVHLLVIVQNSGYCVTSFMDIPVLR